MNTNSAEFVAALRAVADFFDSHPTLPGLDIPYLYKYNVDGETLKTIASTPGIYKEKEYYGDSFYLKAQIPYTVNGETAVVHLSYQGERSSVCKRKVVGTRIVPESYVPGYTRSSYTEEVVEWECEPLTAPSEAEETTENA